MAKSNDKFAFLVNAGNSKEKELVDKNTSSTNTPPDDVQKETVIPTPAVEVPKVVDTPPIQAEEVAIVQPKNEKVEKKSFTRFFTERKDDAMDSVRIPREYHNILKYVSGVSKVSIYTIISNIVEEAIEENIKEIEKMGKLPFSK